MVSPSGPLLSEVDGYSTKDSADTGRRQQRGPYRRAGTGPL